MKCKTCDTELADTWIKCPKCDTSVVDSQSDAIGSPSFKTTTYMWVLVVCAGLLGFVFGSIRTDDPPNETHVAVDEFSELADQSVAAAEAVQRQLSIPQNGMEITVDRFSWEKSGQYCNAGGKLTNTGNSPISSLRITAQFLKNSEMVSSDWSFTDIGNGTVMPGQSVTWSQMYECPVGATSVDLSATDGESLVSVRNSQF